MAVVTADADRDDSGRDGGHRHDHLDLQAAFSRHYGEAHRWATAFTGDPHVADDVVQDAYRPDSDTLAIVADTGDAHVLTPLPDGRFLAITSRESAASDVRFLTPTWQQSDTLLRAQPMHDMCEGTFFGSLRVSPDGHDVAVTLVSWKGGASRECALTLPT